MPTRKCLDCHRRMTRMAYMEEYYENGYYHVYYCKCCNYIWFYHMIKKEFCSPQKPEMYLSDYAIEKLNMRERYTSEW
jgi:hypothetical protein